MGMSASQARLISLEARMNDTEYEAQQINQQRLVLSNKMNEVQEMSMGMEVPVPPSKQDFMYPVYKGKNKNTGNEVTVTRNDDGSFTVTPQQSGTVVNEGNVLTVTKGSKSADKSGATYGKTSSGVPYREKILSDIHWDPGDLGRDFKVKIKGLKPETQVCKDESVLAALAGKDLNGNKTEAGNWKLPDGVSASSIKSKECYYFVVNNQKVTSKEVQDGFEDDGKTPKMKTVDATKDNCDLIEHKDFECTTPLNTGKMVQDNSKEIEITVYANGNIDPATYEAAPGVIPEGYTYSGPDIIAQKCKTQGGKEFTVSKMAGEIAPNALADQGASGIASYWHLNTDLTGTITMQDLVEDTDTYQIKKDLKMYGAVSEGDISESEKSGEIGSDEITVNGKKVLTIEEAEKTYGNISNSKWGDAIAGLKRTFPEADLNNWRVIVDESETSTSFRFCKADQLETVGGSVQTYVVGNGTYDGDSVRVEVDNVEFDKRGNPVSLRYDGNTIKLSYSQECDEEAYELKLNEYNVDKAQYDHDQNELNKKTSIYQRQDKQLELKLTRLDNERNALNTEIEAVKKVIQDSIDRGFKTFSG